MTAAPPPQTYDRARACTRCGACCAPVDHAGVVWRCEHLDVIAPIGTPGASRCRVYDQRVDGMPITLWAPDGRPHASQCWRDSWREDVAIVDGGSGRGCALLRPTA